MSLDLGNGINSGTAADFLGNFYFAECWGRGVYGDRAIS